MEKRSIVELSPLNEMCEKLYVLGKEKLHARRYMNFYKFPFEF